MGELGGVLLDKRQPDGGSREMGGAETPIEEDESSMLHLTKVPLPARSKAAVCILYRWRTLQPTDDYAIDFLSEKALRAGSDVHRVRASGSGWNRFVRSGPVCAGRISGFADAEPGFDKRSNAARDAAAAQCRPGSHSFP